MAGLGDRNLRFEDRPLTICEARIPASAGLGVSRGRPVEVMGGLWWNGVTGAGVRHEKGP
jgi:hypothetical protein